MCVKYVKRNLLQSLEFHIRLQNTERDILLKPFNTSILILKFKLLYFSYMFRY
jgi:hypothetical protein